MRIAPPRVIQSSNISKAWGHLFLDVLNATPHRRTPMVLSLTGFAGHLPDEDAAVRHALDEALSRCQKNTIAVSGMTIFPYDLWQHRGRPSWENSILCA